MAKIKRFLLVFILTLVIGGIVLYKLTVPSWSYDLPNDYKIWKKSNQNVVFGYVIDGDFELQIDEYVAEFQYNNDFIGLKTLVLDGENPVVHFYLIDAYEREVRGPYLDEATYLAVSGVWSSNVLGKWITTTKIPDGAKN